MVRLDKAETPTISDWNLKGFYPRIAWPSRGSGAALGFRYWQRDFWGRLDAAGATFYSLKQYQHYDVQLGLMPHVGRRIPRRSWRGDDVCDLASLQPNFTRFPFYATARFRYLPREDFFGLGPASSLDDRTDYLHEEGRIMTATTSFPTSTVAMLRGYRVFCAWLNHDDSRSINTLDTFIDGHVKHYLIDFGSSLGSGSDVLRNIAPQNPRAGNEYIIDLGHAWQRAYTFGVWDQPWRKVKYPYPQHAEIGRFEGEFFEPEKWVPEYPNPAFDRMLADDAFWAAKIVARFSDDAIRAIVKTGDYLSPTAERYLADMLIKRRDKVVAYFFRLLNPLDQFEVEGKRLRFENLGSESEEHALHPVIPSATPQPTAMPTSATAAPRLRIMRLTCEALAPSAIRTPISPVRWLTMYDCTP